MRYSVFALAAIGVALSGCLDIRQQEAGQAVRSCLLAVYQSPDAAFLRVHVPFNINEATLAQLSDSSTATPAEIAALSIVHPRLRSCQNEFLAKVGYLTPTIVPVFAKFYRDTDDDTVALIQRKMTWGESTRRRRDSVLVRQEAIMSEERRLAAESQARSQAFLQGLTELAVINAASQPKVTYPPAPVVTQPHHMTCYPRGNYLSCD